MYDELTEVDIRKMKEEIEYRTREVRPKIIEDLQTARAFGDLSENYEYKAAKQELRSTTSLCVRTSPRHRRTGGRRSAWCRVRKRASSFDARCRARYVLT